MLVKSVSFLPVSIRSINPIQKYPHIIELFACTRKMLAIMFLFLTNSYFLQEHSQNRNYRNKQFQFCYKIKQSNVCLRLQIYQGLLHKPHLLFFMQVISRIKTIKSRFILIIILYIKVC